MCCCFLCVCGGLCVCVWGGCVCVCVCVRVRVCVGEGGFVCPTSFAFASREGGGGTAPWAEQPIWRSNNSWTDMSLVLRLFRRSPGPLAPNTSCQTSARLGFTSLQGGGGTWVEMDVEQQVAE